MRRSWKTPALQIPGIILCLAATLQAAPTKAPAQKNMLWQVSRGSTSSVYLLGSLHLLKKEDYPLPTAFEKAFTNSTAIVFEVDPRVLNAPETMQKMLKKAILPAGQTLKTQLSAATYKLVKAKLETIGTDMTPLEDFRPWFLSITLSMSKLQDLGFSPLFGIDRHFGDRASQASKKVSGLETVDEQLAFFENMTAPAQDKLVLQTVKEMDSLEEEMLAMREAWRTGNVQALKATLLKSLGEYPEIYETLLVKRNKNWLPRIEALFQQKDRYLVIVGAGHLIGKNGLLDLLRKKGYTTRQL